jgi:hypothetical protein
VKRKHKQYFLYYLKDNILIFDVFDYIEELAADYVDYAFEWNLVKDGFVSAKNIRIKEYIRLYITSVVINMNDKLSKCNCKVLCYYNPKTELNLWSNYFKDPQVFIKIAKKVSKIVLPNFIEIDQVNLFKDIKGTFNNTPCLLPTGEDEDFLLKSLKKLK